VWFYPLPFMKWNLWLSREVRCSSVGVRVETFNLSRKNNIIKGSDFLALPCSSSWTLTKSQNIRSCHCVDKLVYRSMPMLPNAAFTCPDVVGIGCLKYTHVAAIVRSHRSRKNVVPISMWPPDWLAITSHTLYSVFNANLQLRVLPLLLYDMFRPHWAIIRCPAAKAVPL
jgi:hypothetical protein